jgi:hypothetical protein
MLRYICILEMATPTTNYQSKNMAIILFCCCCLAFEADVLCEFCDCEEPPFTLRRYGWWAATPTEPRCAYSIKFLKRAESFMLTAHVLLRAVIEAARFCDGQNHNEVSEFNFCCTQIKIIL